MTTTVKVLGTIAGRGRANPERAAAGREIAESHFRKSTPRRHLFRLRKCHALMNLILMARRAAAFVGLRLAGENRLD